MESRRGGYTVAHILGMLIALICGAIVFLLVQTWLLMKIKSELHLLRMQATERVEQTAAGI